MEQVVYGKSLKKKIDSKQNSIERMKEERRKELMSSGEEEEMQRELLEGGG
jgi:hypothetical protein